ncbi:hypothetical protein H4217_004483 [Coemansia sp. RSA 1939]|nr:hypothetical protein H4217_004483 [Coemansia sp. RSA 1939]KAJ2613521.1 hypothetical protein EV177_002499 [Coemansia sp. RSA 1804]KAJ2691580.1 hypothetical protein GGH99_002311 [Coemansia sp. RSA 1285]
MDKDVRQVILENSRNELRSLGLTHFQYQDGDYMGMALALASLFPIFLVVMEATIVLSRREIAGILLLIGQLGNEGLNIVLKVMIRQDRPNVHLGDGYGMPSSHSQFMTFFLAYTVVYLETRVSNNNVHKRAVQAGAVMLTLLVMTSRVYLGYHSALQVFAGGLVGAVSGSIWLWFVERTIYTNRAIDIVLDWSICRWLLIRDSRTVPDIALAEYRLSRHGANSFKSE